MRGRRLAERARSCQRIGRRRREAHGRIPRRSGERSHRGLVQRFAKPPSGVTCFEGSNPSLSAISRSAGPIACARSSADRASGCGPEGRGFESRRARHPSCLRIDLDDRERAVPPARAAASSRPHRSRLRGAARPRRDGRRSGLLAIPLRPRVRGGLWRDAARLPDATPDRAREDPPANREPVGHRDLLPRRLREPRLVQRALPRARRTVAERVPRRRGRADRRPADPRLRRADVDAAAPGGAAIGKKRGTPRARLRWPEEPQPKEHR